MLELFDPLLGMDAPSVFLRMALAVLCGAVIGLERSYKNRPAGIRTHILICVGATVASVTGLYLYLNAHLPADISRIGAQVVSGLGFIGAGTIIVTNRHTIKGLTTAAGLWASGIIGLALGAGYYEGGLAATALVLITEIVFPRVSANIPHMPEFKLMLRYRHKLALDRVMRYCKDKRLAITNLRVTSDDGEDGTVYTARIGLRPRRVVDRETLLAHIRDIPEILEAEYVEEP